MKKLLPLILAAFGTVAGIGAGYMLQDRAPTMAKETKTPEKDAKPDKKTDSKKAKTAEKFDKTSGQEMAEFEYVKLSNQFVVPILEHETIESLVVISLSLEVAYGETQTIYDLEPKLRDAFLQVLFNHANFGGFSGTFTNYNTMEELRKALDESAHKIAGDLISTVLITELLRQDV